MTDPLKIIQGGLSVIQAMQAGVALINAARSAVANGQTIVSEEEMKAEFADLDLSFDELDASIARAKAEGR